MEPHTDDFSVGPRCAEVLDGIRRMVVPTGADDDQLDLARRAAVHLARERDVEVVLYDRSDERWTDTPHPGGPHGIGDVDAEQRPHLVEQMRALADAGVNVSAWYASVPAITEVLAAVQELDADAVLVPASLGSPRLMDRLQPGDDLGETVGRVLDHQLAHPVHVLVVDDEGTIEIRTTTSAAAQR